MSMIDRLVYLRRHRVLARLAKEVLALYGVEVPKEVEIGPGLRILHRGFGVVIHPSTRICSNVTIYPGVVVGRRDAWLPRVDNSQSGVILEDDVMLGAGAKVLAGDGFMTVGRGTVLGANSVLTCSTGPGEIWAGAPARKLRDR